MVSASTRSSPQLHPQAAFAGQVLAKFRSRLAAVLARIRLLAVRNESSAWAWFSACYHLNEFLLRPKQPYPVSDPCGRKSSPHFRTLRVSNFNPGYLQAALSLLMSPSAGKIFLEVVWKLLPCYPTRCARSVPRDTLWHAVRDR